MLAITALVLASLAPAAAAHDHRICTKGREVLLVDPHDGADPSKVAAALGNPHIPDDAVGGGVYRGLHPFHWFIHMGPSGHNAVGSNSVVVHPNSWFTR